LDNFSNPASTDSLNTPSHSLQHTDINDAVEAMQRKVGVGSAVAGSATAGQVLTISAAGTSTWSTPTTPGLVQVVPTSVAVGSGSGSVDANGAVTFTGASSVSLNDVFSATYDNYKILISFSTTATELVTLRVRVGGTDLSSSTYGTSLYGFTYAGAIESSNGASDTSIKIARSNTSSNATEFFVAAPFLTQNTRLGGVFLDNSRYASFGGIVNNTTSYTGFTFL
jgi:hypothetical protein